MLSELLTPRLRLHPAGPEDLDTLHRLWTEPQVRRWLFDDRELSRQEAADLLNMMCDTADCGSGLWLVETRDGALAGFAGLCCTAGRTEFLVGLHPDHWGRGLAQEAGRAVVAHAFRSLPVSSVEATVDVPNEASIRLLERLGMRREAQLAPHGQPLLVYRVTRDEAAAHGILEGS